MMNSAKVYYCDEYDFECERFMLLLPKERQTKLDRLRLEKDKKNSVGAYLLLLKALRELGVDKPELETGENGKPYIKDNPVFFNLSHSKCGFACAVSSSEIGVDIQETVVPREATLKKVCSEKEREAVLNNSLAFTHLWTLKESVIKKNGETLAQYKKYEFPHIGNDFYAYGNHFASLKENDFVITTCGEFEKIEFIKVKSTEL